jgi:hypothetical protein
MSRQNQRYAARLNKLGDYLEKIPDKHYYHDAFVQRVTDCGTIGCAMGHAITCGLFPGLKVTYNNQGFYSRDQYRFGPIKDKPFDPFDSILTKMSMWADNYFGPHTYDTIFATEPYEGHDAGGAAIKRRVIKNIRNTAKDFAAS